MGISTPKKPFDLKEFLSQKGKPSTGRRRFPARNLGSEAPPAATQDSADADAATDATRDSQD